MKKTFLVLLLISVFCKLSAQEAKKDPPKNGWSQKGNAQLLFNQSAFNKEWTGGGTSSISGNITFDYSLNYRWDNFSWKNKLLANYGLTKIKNDPFVRKTSDRLELNSIAGLALKNAVWNYSYFLNFRTQFAKGYNFGTNPNTGEVIRTEITNFLSPGYLQTGPGFMYKKSEDFLINLAPATVRFIFVDPKFTSGPNYVDGNYFGVDAGEALRFEFGASLSSIYNLQITENILMENSLNLYSNYLRKPGNVDIDYLMNLEMSINRYISANLIFQAIYDDNAVGAFQIREVFGLGINYRI